ncbi:MAG: lysylphosphatidylglycerol synthase transmembrane domain-containing protein [Myxococcota bacterium]
MSSSPGLLSPGFFRRHARAIVASVGLAGGLGYILHKGALPLTPPPGTLDKVIWFKVVLMACGLIVSMIIRFARYQLLISPVAHVPLRRIMIISCIALGLVTFLPFRLGEFVRPAMLRERGKLSGWAVTGTVGAERVMDGLVFGVMLMTGLAFAQPHEPLPDHIGDLPVPAALVPRAAQLFTLVFAVAFVVMAAFFWWRKFARNLTEAVIGVVSKKLAARVAEAVERMSDGLRFLPNLRITLPFLAATLVALYAHIWSMQQLAIGVGLPELNLAEATVVVGVLSLGFALPNAPGFFGAVQLALYAGLAVYVAPEKVVHEGAAFVFLFYTVYLAIVVVVALIGITLEYRDRAQESGATQANQGNEVNGSSA